jgi:hypothetical protein
VAGISRVTCVIVVVWAAIAGCNSFDLTTMVTLKSNAIGNEREVAGSIEAITLSTQSTLAQMGYATNTTRKGETVRIHVKTATGPGFTLVLTKAKSDVGEQTRVRIEWEGEADTNLGLTLLAQIQPAVTK